MKQTPLLFLLCWFHTGSAQLLLEENFDSCCIDYNRWQNSYPWGRNLPANYEPQFYTAGENLEIFDGLLRIKLMKENTLARVDSSLADDYLFPDKQPNLRGFSFTSGMLYSKESFEYGKFEIRCKVPKGKWLWPAFWLYGGWPQQEIDIFEHYGQKKKKLFSTIHFHDGNGKSSSQGISFQSKKSVHKDFITVTLEWLPDKLLFYVNNELAGEMLVAFKGRKHVIVNLAVNAPGTKLPKRIFPKYFEVDYIKVWQSAPAKQSP
jgi:beta-glucanase (GH16 family)